MQKKTHIFKEIFISKDKNTWDFILCIYLRNSFKQAKPPVPVHMVAQKLLLIRCRLQGQHKLVFTSTNRNDKSIYTGQQSREKQNGLNQINCFHMQ